MPNQSWTWRTQQVIPSESASGKRILDEILAQLDAHKWSKRDIFAIHLALEEALVNAIKHGNQWDVSKNVHIDCRLSPCQILVEIRDEGKGFDPCDVPDCTDEERLEMASGRGVLLMRSFMSSVEYTGKGNCVVMTKDRGPADAEDSAYA